MQIGSQRATTITNIEGNQIVNNVGGDQLVAGGQQSAVGDVREGRRLLEALRAQLRAAELPGPVGSAADAMVDGLHAERCASRPDRPAIADRLKRLTQILLSAGALVSAATGVGAPIAALAGWLGAVGRPIRAALDG